MPRSLLLPLIAAALVTPALAGCLEPGANDDPAPALVLTRLHTVDITNEKIQEWAESGEEPSFYDVVESYAVVKISKGSYLASTLTLTYLDQDGNEQTAGLDDFADRLELAPGDFVKVPVDLGSPLELSLEGAVLAERPASDKPSWKAGWGPVGLELDPDTRLAYDLQQAFSYEVGLADVNLEEDDVSLQLDDAHARYRFDHGGTLTSVLRDAPEAKGEDGVTARPLDLVFDLAGTFPMEARAQGSINGHAFDAGIEVADTATALSGTLTAWVNDEGTPVHAEVSDVSYLVDAKTYGWATGLEAEMSDEEARAAGEEFNCFGASREDRCLIDEFEELPIEGEWEGNGEDFPAPAMEAPSAFAERTAWALARADMQPGDEVHVSFRVDPMAMAQSRDPDTPDRAEFRLNFDMTVEDGGRLTVAAGTFDALKVRQTMHMAIDVTEFEADDVQFPGLFVDEPLLDGTLWIDKADGKLLKAEVENTFDMQEFERSFLQAIPDEAWDEAGLDPIDENKVTTKSTATSTIELTEFEGTGYFSPWTASLGSWIPTFQVLMVAGGNTPVEGYDHAAGHVEPMYECSTAEYGDRSCPRPTPDSPPASVDMTGVYGAVSDNTVNQLEAHLRVVPGADPIRLDNVWVEYTHQDHEPVTLWHGAEAGADTFTATWLRGDGENNVMEAGDLVQVTIDLTRLGDGSRDYRLAPDTVGSLSVTVPGEPHERLKWVTPDEYDEPYETLA